MTLPPDTPLQIELKFTLTPSTLTKIKTLQTLNPQLTIEAALLEFMRTGIEFYTYMKQVADRR
jgi:hypothetical protein